jgi:flagellar biosynthesis protein FlhA
MIDKFRSVFGRQSDLFLVLGMVGILVVLFSPIPPRALDFLLLINLSFALLLLLMTFYVEKPVEFSTYPSLLLIATLFRLSLNIAATRLILGSGEAGRVIGAIGSFVVQGNYVIGLVVFLILVVVQYVVVTSGAQRVAEVAARFTLDSMPGHQMSIDADLNMGFIDQAEAQRRRKNIAKETSFYGAMDGASKFVKGDAIAGIVILLIDIFGGLAIGVAQLNMSWAEAAQTFTLLTIGDGIVTQVPALVISIGTGIIVTRSGADTHLSEEVFSQLSAFPKVLMMVAFALIGIGFLPGMPIFPVLVIAFFLIFIARAQQKNTSGDELQTTKTQEQDARTGLNDLLDIQPIEVRVGQGLISLVNDQDIGLADRISAFRKHFALESGLILPNVRMTDDKRLASQRYEIDIFGVRMAGAELMPERTLAIHRSGTATKIAGIETRDPTYQLPAFWIEDDQKSQAKAGDFTLIDPTTVFFTHLTEVLRRNAASLMTRTTLAELIDKVRARNAGLVDDLVPGILSLSEIQKVLQNLLRENVSIRYIDAILEVLVDAGRINRDTDRLTEVVRQRIGPAICQALVSSSGELQVITLDSSIEQKIASSVKRTDESSQIVLDPKFAEQVLGRLAAQVEQAMKSSVMPVLLCAPELRRHLRAITERVLPHLSVISMTEVPSNVALRSVGMVREQ